VQRGFTSKINNHHSTIINPSLAMRAIGPFTPWPPYGVLGGEFEFRVLFLQPDQIGFSQIGNHVSPVVVNGWLVPTVSGMKMLASSKGAVSLLPPA
jgi:hypothetical protein